MLVRCKLLLYFSLVGEKSYDHLFSQTMPMHLRRWHNLGRPSLTDYNPCIRRIRGRIVFVGPQVAYLQCIITIQTQSPRGYIYADGLSGYKHCTENEHIAQYHNKLSLPPPPEVNCWAGNKSETHSINIYVTLRTLSRPGKGTCRPVSPEA